MNGKRLNPDDAPGTAEEGVSARILPFRRKGAPQCPDCERMARIAEIVEEVDREIATWDLGLDGDFGTPSNADVHALSQTRLELIAWRILVEDLYPCFMEAAVRKACLSPAEAEEVFDLACHRTLCRFLPLRRQSQYLTSSLLKLLAERTSVDRVRRHLERRLAEGAKIARGGAA